MTKKYDTPMLQIVSIKQNDIIVTSPGSTTDTYHSAWSTLGADRFRDFEDYSE